MDLPQIVADFGEGLRHADARAPLAVSSRSGKAYSPGLGPHGENKAVALVMHELGELNAYYRSAHPVPYPASRLRCDLGLGEPPEWAIEVKMARAFGDNGKLDDTYLKDLLSPYPADHSALGDASKLRASDFRCRRLRRAPGTLRRRRQVHLCSSGHANQAP